MNPPRSKTCHEKSAERLEPSLNRSRRRAAWIPTLPDRRSSNSWPGGLRPTTALVSSAMCFRTISDSPLIPGPQSQPTPLRLRLGWHLSSVIQARGMRIRVVPETNSADLEYAISRRAEDIVEVFNAFPDSHAVLYTTTGKEYLGVIVDRGDVHGAIETPSGERRAPRLRRSIADASTACEEWLTGMIPTFGPLSIDLLEPPTAPEAAVDPFHLANNVVHEVSMAGVRARIEAKRATWRDFGAQEARQLVAIVQQAQRGQLSEEVYKSHLDSLVGRAA